MLQQYSPLSVDTLLGELLFLKVAAVDFATYLALGNSSAEQNLLNAFFTPFEQLASQRADHARNFATMKSRLGSYSELATTDDLKQFMWNIGKLFATFCKCEMEPTAATVGNIVFGGTVQAVQAALRASGMAK